MSLYLPLRMRGSVAIALCARCGFKCQHDDLVQDPNTKMWVCSKCQDIYDPWKLPARRPEDITLHHPRKDEDLTV